MYRLLVLQCFNYLETEQVVEKVLQNKCNFQLNLGAQSMCTWKAHFQFISQGNLKHSTLVESNEPQLIGN